MNRLTRFFAAGLAAVLLFSACGPSLENTGPVESTPPAPAVLPAQLEGISVSAEEEDGTGIASTTAFAVYAPENPDPELLRQHLAISPETEYTLLAGEEEGHYRMLPSQKLEPGLIYRVEALSAEGQRARTWTFQTQVPLAVLSTTPRGGISGVTRTTGIEVVFSRTDVDMSRHFSIQPAVEGRFFTYGRRAAFAPNQPLDYGTSYTVTIGAGLQAGEGPALAEDYTFSFAVEPEPDAQAPIQSLWMMINDTDGESVLPGDPPVMNIAMHYMKGPQPVDVEVYSISAEDYRGELSKRASWDYDSGTELFSTSALEPAFTFRHILEPENEDAEYDDIDPYPYDGYRVNASSNRYVYGYLPFPRSLEEGYYIAQVRVVDGVTGEETVAQKPLQCSSTAVYFDSTALHNLAWINDAATGQPVSGAEVRLLDADTGERYSSATTAADGSALWENTSPTNRSILQVSRDGAADFMDVITHTAQRPPTVDELYFHTGATDRPSYMPTDTLYVWGTLRGRRSPLPEGATVTLELGEGYSGYDYYWDREPEPPLYTAQATLGADGFYQHEFSIADLEPGYYNVTVKDDGERELASHSILVEEYVKPRYVTSSWSDKAFYLPGEAVDMNVQVSYFDGTPVYGLPFALSFHSRGESEEEPVVYYVPQSDDEPDWTNEDDIPIDEFIPPDIPYDEPGQNNPAHTNDWGVIRAEAVPPFTGDWRPENFSYSFNTSAENYYFSHYGEVTYFPSDLIFRTTLEHPESNTPVLHITTHQLDLSGIHSMDELYSEDYPDNISGQALDVPISVTVTKSTFHSAKEMESIASGYDWASRQTLYRYSYRYESWTEEEVLQSYDSSTQNGRLTLEDLPRLDPEEQNVTYTVTLAAYDSLGNRQKKDISLYPNFYPYFPAENPDQEELQRKKRTNYQSFSLYDVAYYRENNRFSSSDYYVHGAAAELMLVQNQELLPQDGYLLYYLAGEGITDSVLTTENSFTVTQRRELLPGAAVRGAYFDGARLYPVSDYTLYYSTQEDALQVEIITPDGSYPGQEAEVEILVTDPEGNGVPATLMVSVVDEAIFAMSNQYLRPLEELYQVQRRYGYRSGSEYCSYRQHADYYDSIDDVRQPHRDSSWTYFRDPDEPYIDTPNPPTGGGGEPDYTRDTFVDTALFQLVETDEAGRALLTMDLPDNLTSWRVTAAAVGRDSLTAGAAQKQLVASLDLFVNVLYRETYLTGDDVGIALSAQGRALTGSSPVRYTAQIHDEDGKLVLQEERKGRSDSSLQVSFGALPQGSYTLTVRGSDNDHTDSVRYPFSVVPSNLQLPVTRQIPLTGEGTSLDIDALYYPVTVSFADARYGSYATAANRLTQGYSDRLDTILAAVAGRQFLETHFPQEDWSHLEHIPASYKDADVRGYHLYGYYSFSSFYSQDLWDTAMAAMVCGTDLPYVQQVVRTLEDASVFPDPEDDLIPLSYLPMRPSSQEQQDESDDDYNAYLRDYYGVSLWDSEGSLVDEDGVVDPSYSQPSTSYLTADDRAVSLAALACLDQPVLLEIRRRLEEPELFSPTGQLLLVTGLARLGDVETAREFYDTHIAPSLEEVGDYKHMPPRGDDGGYRDTAAALMAASALNHGDAHGLAAYLLNTPSRYYDPVLELALYLDTFQPAEDGETSSFQYRQGGKTHTVELRPGEIRPVRLLREDLEEDSIKLLSGQVTASVSYLGSPDQFRLAYPGDDSALPLELTQEIRPTTGEDLALHNRHDLAAMGNLEELWTVTLRLSLDDTAPGGSYRMAVRFPSSLQASQQTIFLREWAQPFQDYEPYFSYYTDVDGQEHTFMVNHGSFYDEDPRGAVYTISVITRQLYQGQSQPEPVLLLHSQSGLSALIQPQLSGSLVGEAAGTKRIYPQKFISGGTPPVQEDEA